MYDKNLYKCDVTCSWPPPPVTPSCTPPPRAWRTLWTAPYFNMRQLFFKVFNSPNDLFYPMQCIIIFLKEIVGPWRFLASGRLVKPWFFSLIPIITDCFNNNRPDYEYGRLAALLIYYGFLGYKGPDQSSSISSRALYWLSTGLVLTQTASLLNHLKPLLCYVMLIQPEANNIKSRNGGGHK